MKKIKTNEIAYLNITSWRGALMAMHFYGNVKFQDNEHHLEYLLNKEQADFLNEKDGCEDWAFTYEAGMNCNRYETKEQIEQDAVKYFHEELETKGAKMLCVGDSVYFQPQKAIAFADGYGSLALKFSELYQRGEFCDWDFTKKEDELILDKICKEWESLLDN